MNIVLNKMYYLPSSYYFLEENDIYKGVYNVLVDEMKYKKNRFDRIIASSADRVFDRITIKSKLIEKTVEYNEYKSSIIKVILAKYAHINKDGTGKELIDDIMNKWNNNEKILKKYRDLKYENTVTTITKYEKEINNIEKILMLFSIQILENYYN
jgi:hypothetical protein